MRMRLALLIALAVPALAHGADGGPGAARDRYLPAAQAAYANTPDGAQARYDAGRDLVEAVVAVGGVPEGQRAMRADLLGRGRAQVARAEALDRNDGFRSLGPLAPLPSAATGIGPRWSRLDAGPASRCGGRVGERRRRDLGARPEHRAATRATSRKRASRPRRR